MTVSLSVLARCSILSLSLAACGEPRGAIAPNQTPSPPAAASPAAGPAVAAAAPVAAPIDKQLARPDVIASSAPISGFKRGINLGNGLDAPSEGAWGTKLSEKHFAMAKSGGFDHVRLPVRFTTAERSDPNPPYAVKEDFFKRVDWAIDQALAQKLSVIVDVHHFEEIHKDPQANKQRLYAIWKQIGARYAARPPEVAFEILNEPNSKLEPPLLNELTAEALRLIREKNPTRLVFANSYFWAAADKLAELKLPAGDANVVAQFHMYQPILFTHQGADWMDPWCQTKGLIFPGPPAVPLEPVPAAAATDWVKRWFDGYNNSSSAENPGGPRTVFEHFDHAARYVKASGKRVYLGEFGAIEHADEQSRANYLWLVRTEAERRGVGWAYWDDGGKFKLMDANAGTWNEPLRRALFDG
jgi:endoglucanase